MGNNILAEGTWFSQSTNTDTNLSAFSIWTEKDQIHSDVHKRTFASGKYLCGSVLGQGGWSTVYKIQRVGDGKILAGKASKSVSQLYKETKWLRKLSHVRTLLCFSIPFLKKKKKRFDSVTSKSKRYSIHSTNSSHLLCFHPETHLGVY